MEKSMTVWGYIEQRMQSLEEEGRKVTASNYGKASRCLRRYCGEDNLVFADITEEFVSGFNAYLYRTGIQKPTVSFYNRILRSIYNQAAREGIVKNAHPFDGAYTKVEVRLAPVSSRATTHDGRSIDLDDLPKEEIVRRYRTLQTKYNSLVSKLTSIVGA